MDKYSGQEKSLSRGQRDRSTKQVLDLRKVDVTLGHFVWIKVLSQWGREQDDTQSSWMGTQRQHGFAGAGSLLSHCPFPDGGGQGALVWGMPSTLTGGCGDPPEDHATQRNIHLWQRAILISVLFALHSSLFCDALSVFSNYMDGTSD